MSQEPEQRTTRPISEQLHYPVSPWPKDLKGLKEDHHDVMQFLQTVPVETREALLLTTPGENGGIRSLEWTGLLRPAFALDAKKSPRQHETLCRIDLFHCHCREENLPSVQRFLEEQLPELRSRIAHIILSYGLLEAVKYGRLGVAKLLLERFSARSLQITGQITVAACLNEPHTLEFLQLFATCHGTEWNPDLQTEDGTGLSLSIEREDVVRFLLLHGANPNKDPVFCEDRRDSGWDLSSGEVLNRAAEWSTPAVFDLLLEHGADLNYALPLHHALWATDPDRRWAMVKHLVNMKGIDVNGKASASTSRPHRSVEPWDTTTPLHWAIHANLTSTALYLIRHGANMAIEDGDGRSCFEAVKRIMQERKTASARKQLCIRNWRS